MQSLLNFKCQFDMQPKTLPGRYNPILNQICACEPVHKHIFGLNLDHHDDLIRLEKK